MVNERSGFMDWTVLTRMLLEWNANLLDYIGLRNIPRVWLHWFLVIAVT